MLTLPTGLLPLVSHKFTVAPESAPVGTALTPCVHIIRENKKQRGEREGEVGGGRGGGGGGGGTQWRECFHKEKHKGYEHRVLQPDTLMEKATTLLGTGIW